MVRVPPSMVAKETGMSSADEATPTEPAQSLMIGIIIAQTGELFMKADMAITAIVMRSIADS